MQRYATHSVSLTIFMWSCLHLDIIGTRCGQEGQNTSYHHQNNGCSSKSETTHSTHIGLSASLVPLRCFNPNPQHDDAPHNSVTTGSCVWMSQEWNGSCESTHHSQHSSSFRRGSQLSVCRALLLTTIVVTDQSWQENSTTRAQITCPDQKYQAEPLKFHHRPQIFRCCERWDCIVMCFCKPCMCLFCAVITHIRNHWYQHFEFNQMQWGKYWRGVFDLVIFTHSCCRLSLWEECFQNRRWQTALRCCRGTVSDLCVCSCSLLVCVVIFTGCDDAVCCCFALLLCVQRYGWLLWWRLHRHNKMPNNVRLSLCMPTCACNCYVHVCRQDSKRSKEAGQYSSMGGIQELYYTEAQFLVRHHANVEVVQKWLNSFWESNGCFVPDQIISYFDRLRYRFVRCDCCVSPPFQPCLCWRTSVAGCLLWMHSLAWNLMLTTVYVVFERTLLRGFTNSVELLCTCIAVLSNFHQCVYMYCA